MDRLEEKKCSLDVFFFVLMTVRSPEVQETLLRKN